MLGVGFHAYAVIYFTICPYPKIQAECLVYFYFMFLKQSNKLFRNLTHMLAKPMPE